MADTAVPRFDSVRIDCPDPAELARFYGTLLDWQMHLDLAVHDLEAAHKRAVGLGARHLDSREKFRVYADPVGHLFCLCQW